MPWYSGDVKVPLSCGGRTIKRDRSHIGTVAALKRNEEMTGDFLKVRPRTKRNRTKVSPPPYLENAIRQDCIASFRLPGEDQPRTNLLSQ